ncbi:hypothetical protein SEUCBS139899_003669 [Sporothrix eucalyptigena]|uniref:Anaphase-promoting complex subunit 13 n=1 Tax=Sporothrix eucalyptigena TaxID=1812306 RepID=A0ABP0BQB8_9PEZI
MNKDGCYTSVHMHHPRTADLFEDVCKDRLPNDDIFVPPQHQPINPEDEDDVVPDQHAAFGIQRATQAVREPAWKDLGLSQLMRGPKGPVGSAAASNTTGRNGSGASGTGTAPSYNYYAYYYGYNANGITAGGAGGSGNDLPASPAGAAQRPAGAHQRNHRGIPR